MRGYYAWSDCDAWLAPDSPRLTFAGRSFLFKVQIQIERPSEEIEAGTDAGQQFLTALRSEFLAQLANHER